MDLQQIIGWILTVLLLVVAFLSQIKKKGGGKHERGVGPSYERRPPQEDEWEEEEKIVKRQRPPPSPTPEKTVHPFQEDPYKIKDFDFEGSLESHHKSSDIEGRSFKSAKEEDKLPDLVGTHLSKRFDLDPAYALKIKSRDSRSTRILKKGNLKDLVLFSEILKRPYLD